MTMRRFLPVLLALGAAPLLAQPVPGTPPPLNGRIEGHTYVSPVGTFRMSIPVLPELGGTVNDTPNVVTFQDAFNVHVSIGCFQMDATQRWELSTRGLKDYLPFFFENFVIADFRQVFPDTQIESDSFSPDLMDGAYMAFTLMPGGSMFGDKHTVLGSDDTPPVAKRGNLVFLHGDYIFIISTELAERVIERSTYKKTPAEEDEILRRRLADIVKRIEFTTPPPKS